MILKITGKDKLGHTDFEKTLTLSEELLYEIRLGKRIVFTQLKMTNKEIFDGLVEEMKEWGITCERENGYMIFKKDDKVYELLDITVSAEQPFLDPMFYKKMLADTIMKKLL
jgi:di/tripeptidase